jgi:hypothetical protein
VQVDPIKPTWKAPGSKSLILKYDKRVSDFGFSFNLRHYTTACSNQQRLFKLTALSKWVHHVQAGWSVRALD